MKTSPKPAQPRLKQRLPRKENPVTKTFTRFLLGGVALLGITAATIQRTETPTGSPDATIDLATDAGVQLVKGQWRYHDTKIVDADFRGPGADGQPTGSPVKTYDFTPHAGGADFDDSAWESIGATTLEQRRGNGRLGFNWYRIAITIPDRIGAFDPTGTTAVF